MATQTKRTTQRSARFFTTTVTASMVTACCGLVLWSAVAAHAGVYANGMPFQGLILNGTPLNGLPWNGIGPNGMPFNGMPMQGMPRNGLPVNGTPLHGLPAYEGSLSPEQSESLPWSTLSQRALGDATAPFVSDHHDTPTLELPEVR
jgi:hypothetical protein